MAIYYSRMSAVSRARGQSCVAAAAYRAGARMRDDRDGRVHDYRRRHGVLHVGMHAPREAGWALDSERVWARAEQAERRCNARTARELVLALPAELTAAQNIELAQRITAKLVDRYGFVSMVAVHAPDRGGDARNMHAHILMSTRAALSEGFGKKIRILDDRATGRTEALAIRALAARAINEALARHGHWVAVDPRSWRVQARNAEERGDFRAAVLLARVPMVHQGPAATALARRGEPCEVVERNEATRRFNAETLASLDGEPEPVRRVSTRSDGPRARPPRTARAQEARKGIGAAGTVTRATGPDAELLNAQVRLVEQGAQAARDACEAYMDALARAANQLAMAARAELLRGLAAAGQAERHAEPLARAPMPVLSDAMLAFAAHRRAEREVERLRRQTAGAEHATALARRRVDAPESEPPAWRPMTRRRWAELRRAQRTEAREREATERDSRLARDRAADVAASHERAWRQSHSLLLEHLVAVPSANDDAASRRTHPSRPAPRLTPRRRPRPP